MNFFSGFINKIEHASLRFCVFIIVITGYLVYFRALFGEFLWDDLAVIPNNPAIQNIANIPFFFTRSVFYSPATNDLIGLYYRPFTTTIASLLYQVWGLNTFGYHLFDITIHILNSVLIFFLISRLLKLNNLHFAKTASFITTLLFLVHPAAVESVAYISGTSDVLDALFLLGAMLFTLSYGQSKKQISGILIGLITTVLFCLFAKESGVLVIALILCLSFLYFPKKTPVILGSFIFPIGLYSLFRFHIVALSESYKTSLIPIFQTTVWQRLLLIPYELFSYIRLTFFPFNLHVGEQGIIKSINDPKFYGYLPLVLAFIILLFFLVKKIKSKITMFFLFWIFISLLPFLNILIPLDFTIDERWLYTALIGVAGFCAVVISKIFAMKREKYKMMFFYLLCFFFVFFFIRTFIRTLDWSNELALFGHDVLYVKDSSELYTNYANALYRGGNIELSKEEFGEALKLAPDNFYALNNLGSIYAGGGQYDKAKVLFEKSASVAPTTETYENICLIDYLTQKPEQVILCAQKALSMFPNSAKLNQLMALSLFTKGQKQEAKSYAQKSLQFDPSQENQNALIQVLR